MIFIGIAGPSAAGKTTLASYLAATYKDQFEHLRQDDYLKQPETFPEIHGMKNWMFPGNTKFDLIFDHLRKLQLGEKVLSRTFAWQPDEVVYEYYLSPKPFVLVDGIYSLLDEKVDSMLDIKIYLDVAAQVTLARRKQRVAGKFVLDEVDRLITLPEYERYGVIQKTKADFIVDGNREIKTVALEVKQLIENFKKT